MKKMSSPTKLSESPVGQRESQRVILREITASLQNSPPPLMVNNKNVNDVLTKPPSEHEVKVKFAREFGDVVNYPPPPQLPSITIDSNSLSPASSFQSVTSSFSAKSSGGIEVDTQPRSSCPSQTNTNYSDLDDLISACAAINLNDTTTITGEQSFTNASFKSPTTELDRTINLSESRSISPQPDLTSTQSLEKSSISELVHDRLSPDLNSPECVILQNIDDSQDTKLSTEQISPEYATANETLFNSSSVYTSIQKTDLELNGTFFVPTSSEFLIQSNEQSSPVIKFKNSSPPQKLVEKTNDVSLPSELPTLESILHKAESVLLTSLSPKRTTIADRTLTANTILQLSPDICANDLSTIEAPTSIETPNILESTRNSSSTEPTAQPSIVKSETQLKEDCEILVEQIKQEENEWPIEVAVNQQAENIDGQLNRSASPTSDQILAEPVPIVAVEENHIHTSNNLDVTININDVSSLIDATKTQYSREPPLEEKNREQEANLPIQAEYETFVPQKQSTGINDLFPTVTNTEVSPVSSALDEAEFFDAYNSSIANVHVDFEEAQLKEKITGSDIHDNSVELIDDNNICTQSDLWRDPSNFDFLFSKESTTSTIDRLRSESLYVKFDPLVSERTMLPQGNGATAPSNEERNGEKEASVPNIGTPKHNPALAAIDRLLFYSPMSLSNQKNEEPKKIETEEKTTPELAPMVDPTMAKELELVRATVLQLEEQLEKQKKEYDQQEKEHKVDREAFREAITQLQKQLNQEIKSKDQINVVVDEYEKSISRLIAEREQDRKSLDVEKSSLLKELQEVKNHLAASEAAFNDVHAKYERLKVVVTASKNNEAALKESIAENVEIIKTLEDRYDQIKTHAAVRLEKANQELEIIRKQHESETLKLRAMLKKEELKSNSLAEMIEQKTKENSELTKILDEVIARVDDK